MTVTRVRSRSPRSTDEATCSANTRSEGQSQGDRTHGSRRDLGTRAIQNPESRMNIARESTHEILTNGGGFRFRFQVEVGATDPILVEWISHVIAQDKLGRRGAHCETRIARNRYSPTARSRRKAATTINSPTPEGRNKGPPTTATVHRVENPLRNVARKACGGVQRDSSEKHRYAACAWIVRAASRHAQLAANAVSEHLAVASIPSQPDGGGSGSCFFMPRDALVAMDVGQ